MSLKELPKWYDTNIGYGSTAALVGALVTEKVFLTKYPERVDATVHAGVMHDIEMMASMGVSAAIAGGLVTAARHGISWARSHRAPELSSEEFPAAQLEL